LFVGVFAGWCTSWTIGKWLALRKMVGDHERILELRRIVDEQKRSRGLEGKRGEEKVRGGVFPVSTENG
jgi:hypothetical protein